MDKKVSILAKTELFRGISPEETLHMLKHLQHREEQYLSENILQWEQSRVNDIGILLSGSAIAYRTTPSGNQVIMSRLHPASVFGDILAADPMRTSPVTIEAAEQCTVLYIDYNSFITGSIRKCSGYAQLMHNYIETISRRYFSLQDRIACLILPSLREKILYFLMEQSGGKRGETFQIPFDRAGMANYLNADRSALSRELSLLQKEGKIDYHKDHFKLL